MIDTIQLMVMNYEIRNRDLFKFKTNSRKMFSFGYMKPEKDGIYRPKLSVIEGIYGYYLFIKFSIPKFVFGNNLRELKGTEFKGIVYMLVKAIDELEVTVTEETITNATVRRVDYSKNLILNKRNIICADVINIAQTSSYPRLKFWEVIKGKYIKFSSKSLSIMFYDKLEEMKNHNSIYRDFPYITLMADNRILRIEIQIKGKYGVEQRLPKMCGKGKCQLRFKDVFNKNIMQKVFNYNLRILNDKLPDVILEGKEIEELCACYRKPNVIGKKNLFLTLQKNCKGYEAGKEKAIELYGENFVKKNNCILVNNENLQFILLKFLEEIKDYTPLFNA